MKGYLLRQLKSVIEGDVEGQIRIGRPKMEHMKQIMIHMGKTITRI